MLTAIAEEDKLYRPNAKSFLAKQKMGMPSNVQRSLEELLLKEMIFIKRWMMLAAITGCTIAWLQDGWNGCIKITQFVLDILRNKIVGQMTAKYSDKYFGTGGS